MNCLRFRRLAIAEPNPRDENFLEHMRACKGCRQFAREIEEFNHELREAIEIQAPDRLAGRILLRQSPGSRSRALFSRAVIYALAASVLFTGGLSLGLFVHERSLRSGLQETVAIHVNEWMEARASDGPVPAAKVSQVLAGFGMKLNKSFGTVTYAVRCVLGENDGVHLVVAEEDGPVTVFLMPEVEAGAETILDTGLYSGIVVPCPRGSMALVGYRGAKLQAVADRIQDSVVWM